MLAQHALHAVERAADDGDVARVDAVISKLPPRNVDEPRQVDLVAVELRRPINSAQYGVQIGK